MFAFRSDDEVLDAIAGQIDAPSLWRFQFFVAPTFFSQSVVMLEGDSQSAAAYLWILKRKALHKWDFSVSSRLSSNDFEVQEARELSKDFARYWQNWPLSRVGETVEEVPYQSRDGIGIFFRSFNGSTFCCSDLTNPDRVFQPLRWQASEEMFEMFNLLFDWNAKMAALSASEELVWKGRRS